MRVRENLRWAGKVMFPAGRRRLPEQVIFFITDKCNLACSHCFYWERLNRQTNEASLVEIERFSRSLGRFSFLTLTGGEPFLREDIPEIVRIFRKNNAVSSVSIPTNGFFTERIVKTTAEIARAEKGMSLSVKISFDGPPDRHNVIRGSRTAFKNAVDSCHGLLALRKTYPLLKVGVIITYSTLNQHDIAETLAYIEKDLKPDLVSLTFVRGDVRDPRIKEADVSRYRALQERILSRSSGRFYRAYKSKVSEMVAAITGGGRYFFPCLAGKFLCVIDSGLNVYPCETLNRSLGNLRECNYDFAAIWFSDQAEAARSEIVKNKCRCSYECGLQISTFFNIRALLSLVPGMVWQPRRQEKTTAP